MMQTLQRGTGSCLISRCKQSKKPKTAPGSVHGGLRVGGVGLTGDQLAVYWLGCFQTRIWTGGGSHREPATVTNPGISGRLSRPPRGDLAPEDEEIARLAAVLWRELAERRLF